MNKLKLIILIFCALLLCGCNKKCIKSHKETKTCVRPQCIFINDNPVCINQFYTCQQTICDKWGEK